MFKNVGDNGILSILDSSGKKPLSLWDKKVRTGHIRRVTDSDLQILVLEIVGSKKKNSYITCPGDIKKTLGVKFPILVVTLKNLRKVFAFDVQILDENNVRRRFKVSTLTDKPEVKPFICKVPLLLEEGWNQVVIPLQEFTKKIYDTNYKETLRIQIYPNCRIQKVFFTNKLYKNEGLLADYKFFQPEEFNRFDKTILGSRCTKCERAFKLNILLRNSGGLHLEEDSSQANYKK